MRAIDISIIGATGAVGAELIKLLESSQLPVSRLRLLASRTSVGRRLRFRDEICIVEPLDEIDDTQADIAFFSAGRAVSAKYGPLFAAQGALVIDNSNAFRMNPDVPLLVPQINPNALAARPRSGIVENPNCSAIQLVRALRPLVTAFHVHQIILTTYQAASGGGLKGIDELLEGSRAALAGRAPPRAKHFPFPLAFNVIPQVGEITSEGVTLEERKRLQESRKLLGLPHLRLTSSCVRVPVVNGHPEAVYLELEESVHVVQVRELLTLEPDFRLSVGGPHVGYPTPRHLTDPAIVHVARVKVNPENPYCLWIVADNLKVRRLTHLSS
ncbi:aspartate-semialdehyde dehydrogenase (plasmid) [Rhizobium sp. CCGE 510]|nr:aspartate-semialdehyde dehydrogenase [Rhizobium sp. CCGE 510]